MTERSKVEDGTDQQWVAMAQPLFHSHQASFGMLKRRHNHLADIGGSHARMARGGMKAQGYDRGKRCLLRI